VTTKRSHPENRTRSPSKRLPHRLNAPVPPCQQRYFGRPKSGDRTHSMVAFSGCLQPSRATRIACLRLRVLLCRTASTTMVVQTKPKRPKAVTHLIERPRQPTTSTARLGSAATRYLPQQKESNGTLGEHRTKTAQLEKLGLLLSRKYILQAGLLTT